jgi:hypothetical protein
MGSEISDSDGDECGEESQRWVFQILFHKQGLASSFIPVYCFVFK